MSDLLDAMEQRAHEHLLLNWRDTLADDVLALVGRVREMDATMAGLRARCVRDEARLKAATECADASEAYEVEYLQLSKVSKATSARYAAALAAWRKVKGETS